MTLNQFFTDKRGVSPAVGYIFIIGFVVIMGLGLYLTGGQIFVGDEDPRIDANFNLDIENTTHIELYYDTGDEFTTDNTDELYIIGRAGTTGGDTIDKTMLYNESGVIQSEDPVAKLESGTLVVNASRAQDNGIEPGSAIQIVWEPKSHDNLQLVIDEMVVPSHNRIMQVTDVEGDFTLSGSIDIGGCDPRNEDEDCEN